MRKFTILRQGGAELAYDKFNYAMASFNVHTRLIKGCVSIYWQNDPVISRFTKPMKSLDTEYWTNFDKDRIVLNRMCSSEVKLEQQECLQ